MEKRYFEDVDTGEKHELGSWSVTRDDIIEFAERYDPQPFHTDEEAARESMYGGLIASGWQTVALSMRTMVDGFLQDVTCVGARGVDDLRWHRPVYPGDIQSIRIEVIEKRRSETNPAIGDVRIETTGTNPDGQKTVSWINNFLLQRRASE